MDRLSNICFLDESTNAISEIPKVNWTKFVYERQISGRRFPKSRWPRRQSSSTNNSQSSRSLSQSRSQSQNSNPSDSKRRDWALREFRLSQIVPSVNALEDVFLGFSICSSYLYSYREVAIPDDDLFVAPRTYFLNVWRFVPGKRLKLAFSAKLFNGETFTESLCIRVQQQTDISDLCIIIGNIHGGDVGNLTKTFWHTILVTPCSLAPPIALQADFYAMYALSSYVRPEGYLMITTCDEVILVDLNKAHELCRNGLKNTSILKLDRLRETVPWFRIICEDYKDISKARMKCAYYFSYASQILQWCTEASEKALNSNCVGLSDYHLYIDEISSDSCNGCIFALYDVDTLERNYFEAWFTFHWNFKSNTIERDICDIREVTDRTKEPGRQQRAFQSTKSSLFKCVNGKMKPKYQLWNMSVLEGYSLKRIFDPTACIALTL